MFEMIECRNMSVTGFWAQKRNGFRLLDFPCGRDNHIEYILNQLLIRRALVNLGQVFYHHPFPCPIKDLAALLFFNSTHLLTYLQAPVNQFKDTRINTVDLLPQGNQRVCFIFIHRGVHWSIPFFASLSG